MVKPLVFKGEKKPKKRKRVADPTHDDAPDSKAVVTASTASTAGNEDDDSWVNADAATDIAGPVVIVLPSEPPTCLASDANGKVFASQLENFMDGDPSTAEPHDVRQVWVVNRVHGTESFSFKGHHVR